MAEKEGRLQADSLFQGLTRPAMVLGVSYLYFLLNSVITLIVFINTQDFLTFVFAGSVHGIGYLICLKEPRAIELLMMKTSKTLKCRNRPFHGFTNSYDQF